MSLNFDTVHGEVHLPNGLIIRPALTRTQLINSCAIQNISLRPYTISSAPFKWFAVDGGQVEEEPLGVEFRFWGELLISADLHLDDNNTVLNFDQRTAFVQQVKSRHDALLKDLLGESHELWDERRGNEHSIRLFPVYRYPWGKITSLQDGHVFIRVEYAGRRKAAETKFQRISVPDQLSVVERFRKRPR